MTTKNNRVVLNLSIDQAVKLKSILESIPNSYFNEEDRKFFSTIAQRIEKTLNKEKGGSIDSKPELLQAMNDIANEQ